MALDVRDTRFLPDIGSQWSTYTLLKGDLLFTRYNGSRELVGVCALVRETPSPALVYPDKLIRVRVPMDEVDPSFIEKAANIGISRATIDDYLKTSAGQIGISGSDLKEVPIPLPPLPEQRRIVSKIESLTARSRRAKEALDAVPTLLEKFRQSVLAAAFRGDLTAEWRAKNPDVEPADVLLQRIRIERRKRWEEAELAKMRAKGKVPGDDRWKAKYEEPAPIDTSELPELPAGWAWASVAELSTKVVDGVHKKPNYVQSGIPFLTVKNLTAGRGISFEEVNYVSRSDHEEFIKRTDPEFGDILITKDGTLGIPRLVRTRDEFSIFVSLALVKPIFRDCGEYLELAFTSPYFQERFKKTGTGIQHIHLVDLRAAALPIAPISEQCEIVNRCNEMLTRLEKLDLAHRDSLDSLRHLDRAILSKAFRGELVPQDPHDEPASVLLERIRAEAATQDGPTKKRAGKKRG